MSELSVGTISLFDSPESEQKVLSSPVLQVYDYLERLIKGQKVYILLLSDSVSTVEAIVKDSKMITLCSCDLEKGSTMLLEKYQVVPKKNGDLKPKLVLNEFRLLSKRAEIEGKPELKGLLYFHDDEDTPAPKPSSSMPKYAPPNMSSSSSSSSSSKTSLHETKECTISELSTTMNFTPKLTLSIAGKGAKRTWSNAKGSGVLANVKLQDEQKNVIEITFFNDHVTDFYDAMNVGDVWVLTNPSILQANMKYNPINNLQLQLKKTSTLVKCEEGTGQMNNVDLVEFHQLGNIDTSMTVNVIGVVAHVKPMVIIKKDKTINIRHIILVDIHGTKITFTVFGDQALRLDEHYFKENPVVLLRQVGISNYNNQLSVVHKNYTQVELNPSYLKETEEYSKYFKSLSKEYLANLIQSGDSSRPPTPYDAPRINVQSLKGLTPQSKQYYSLKCYVDNVNRNDGNSLLFMSCGNVSCGKKLVFENDNYYCKVCSVQSEAVIPKFNFNINVIDETGCVRLTVFSAGEKLYKKSAKEMDDLHIDPSKSVQYNQLVDSVKHNEYVFLLGVTLTMNNNSPTTNIIVEDVCSVDLQKELDLLLYSCFD